MKKRITITEIAKEAGVSVATVSRVFNNKELHKVSRENRELLGKLMEKYQYSPNPNARGLASGRNRMIGFQIASILSPIMNATVFEALTRCAHENNYTIVTGLSNWDHQEEEKSIAAMLKRGIDGLIWQPLVASTTDLPMREKIPLIYFNKDLSPQIPSIGTDEEATGEMAAEYLIKHRIKNIFYVGSSTDYHTPFRLNGWRKACHDNNYPEAQMINVLPSVSALPEELLSEVVPGNGFFCTNYRIALMLENVMRNRGIESTGHIITYGDISITDYFLQKLPLIAPDSEKTAALLFQAILNRIDNKAVPLHQKIKPLLKINENI